MTKKSGKDLYVSFAGTALSSTIRSFEVPKAQETADATAAADEYRNYVKTVKTVEATCEILVPTHATGGSALKAVVAAGAEGTLLWGEEGTATGKPKNGFYAMVSDCSETIPYDDVHVLNITFTMAGTALLYNGVTDLW